VTNLRAGSFTARSGGAGGNHPCKNAKDRGKGEGKFISSVNFYPQKGAGFREELLYLICEWKKCPPGFLLLDLDGGIYIMVYMTSEFDWFMVTMPIFAIVVYLIVMIGSMEKQPKFLETEGVKKLTGLVFVALFGGGILVSLYYMIIRFLDCLASY